MKNILLIFTLLFFNFLTAQNIGIEKTKVTRLYVNSKSLIFNKKDGQQISYNEFQNLLKKDPMLGLEVKEEDLNGNPISYYVFNKNEMKEKNSGNLNKIPYINRKDIYNKVFKLENYQNKKVLIILQPEFQFPAINVTDLKFVENHALKKDNFNSVILTFTNKDISKIFTIDQGFKSIIIPNAYNLINKFGFKRFPIFLICDSFGNVLEFTYDSDEMVGLLNKY